MIEIRNVTFWYAGDAQSAQRPVLRDLSLTLRPGESVGIMGPNGSGKTTLARCLNGLLVPHSGEVLVDGMNTRDATKLPDIRRRVGMVFQNPENQIVATTVEREIAFGLENIGVPHDEMHRIVDDMLTLLDLQRYRLQPPHLLSGGEMQRLALAAVLAMSPHYIVFDEPTSLLDPSARQLVLRLIRDLTAGASSGSPSATPILITQFPEEVLAVERLLILHNGSIVFDDNPEQVFQNVDELAQIGLPVPVEFAVKRTLETLSRGTHTLNPSDFLPIK